MQELGLDRVYNALNEALGNQDYPRMAAMLWPALDQFPTDHNLLHFATHILTKENKFALAMLCALKANELEPNQANYTNMGSIFRRLNMVPEAMASLEEAIGYDPGNKHPWNNLAAAHVNEGNPLPGIKASAKALEIDPEFDKARWNKGLLELEAGHFDIGFDDYRSGLVIGERMMKNYSGGEEEPEFLTDIEVLRAWRKEHGKKPRLIVWGEQGIGDELMFSTCLADLSLDADIIFDCHPRLHKIMFDSHKAVLEELFPTRKQSDAPWYPTIEPCQFKCSIGDLPRWYRRSYGAFVAAQAQMPFLTADPELVERYKESLEETSPGKKHVGIAWTGGIINTQRWYRCCQLEELTPIISNDAIQPVSLQYEDDSAAVESYLESHGKLIHRFPGVTTHFDYHHTLALVQALDAVVTVCQSVAHLSAAAGQKTFVLVPDTPAWRYGLEGMNWFWYGPNMLYRRSGEPWGPAVEALNKDLLEHLG